MKKISLLFFTAVVYLSAAVNFEYDLKVAQEKAISENKKLMIMYSSETCPECNYMKKKVLKDEELSNAINKKFVSVMLDVSNNKKDLPYKYIGIPTIYFSNPSDMSLITKRIGGTREAKLLEIINTVK